MQKEESREGGLSSVPGRLGVQAKYTPERENRVILPLQQKILQSSTLISITKMNAHKIQKHDKRKGHLSIMTKAK